MTGPPKEQSYNFSVFFLESPPLGFSKRPRSNRSDRFPPPENFVLCSFPVLFWRFPPESQTCTGVSVVLCGWIRSNHGHGCELPFSSTQHSLSSQTCFPAPNQTRCETNCLDCQKIVFTRPPTLLDLKSLEADVIFLCWSIKF